MTHPMAPKPGDPVKQIGQVFGTPLIINGWTWLPFNQVIAWVVFTWLSMRKKPVRSLGENVVLGGMKMVVFLGSEWLHNLAHTAAARQVGQPTDALLIYMGMPLVIYHHPDDSSVTPRQHILRSAAGPIFTSIMLVLARIVRLFTSPDRGLREVVDTAVGMNAFISTISLVPNPNFDGGPLLKWGLVARGKSPERAETILKTTNRVVGAGLAGAAGTALVKRSWLAGVVMAFLSAASLAYGFRRPQGNGLREPLP